MKEYTSIDPASLTTIDRHQYLTSLVAPRPIALVSSISDKGNPNLAPFSYFTALSSTPPIVGFSCNLDAHGNEKDTLQNIKATGVCVINIVSYDMIDQMLVCSKPFDSQINEFDESQFTSLPSDLVKPARVAESHAQLECRLKQVLNWTKTPGAANFIICDIVKIHCATEDYLRTHRLDPHKLDQIGRLGRKYYTRVSGDIFEPKI